MFQFIIRQTYPLDWADAVIRAEAYAVAHQAWDAVKCTLVDFLEHHVGCAVFRKKYNEVKKMEKEAIAEVKRRWGDKRDELERKLNAEDIAYHDRLRDTLSNYGLRSAEYAEVQAEAEKMAKRRADEYDKLDAGRKAEIDKIEADFKEKKENWVLRKGGSVDDFVNTCRKEKLDLDGIELVIDRQHDKSGTPDRTVITSAP